MLWNEKWELRTQSLRALSYALRHKEVWPKRYRWDYSYIDACAIALAAELWDQIDLSSNTVKADLAEAFDMPKLKVGHIFYGKGNWVPRDENRCKDYNLVTPGMVAEQIDLYLAGR